MHAGRPEGRSYCGDKLLSSGLRRRFGFFVSDAIEAISHSNIKLAWPRNLQAELMKLSAAGDFVKRGFIRPVSNQVVALLIVNDALDAGIQVVIVTKGESAGLLGQIVQTILRLKKVCSTITQTLLDLLSAHPRGGVGGCQGKSLQATSIHCIDEHGSSIGQIGELSQRRQHSHA